MTVLFALLIPIALFASYWGFGWYTVPKFHYGVKFRLQKPLPGTIPHGPHHRWLFIDQVYTYSTKLQNKEFSVPVPTKDGTVYVNGLLEYSCDPEAVDEQGINVFARLNEGQFDKGIKDGVESDVGEIGGQMDTEDFVQRKDDVILLLDATFQLKDPPHLKDAGAASGDKLAALDYYRRYEAQVRQLLETEAGDQKSRVEQRYGIRVANIEFDISFSPEVEAARSKQQRAELNAGAVDVTLQKAAKVRKELGVDGRTALDAVQAAIGDVDRSSISIDGGSIGDAALAKIAAGGLSVTERNPKKKE